MIQSVRDGNPSLKFGRTQGVEEIDRLMIGAARGAVASADDTLGREPLGHPPKC